jgi:hypothetical protein
LRWRVWRVRRIERRELRFISGLDSGGGFGGHRRRRRVLLIEVGTDQRQAGAQAIASLDQFGQRVHVALSGVESGGEGRVDARQLRKRVSLVMDAAGPRRLTLAQVEGVRLAAPLLVQRVPELVLPPPQLLEAAGNAQEAVRLDRPPAAERHVGLSVGVRHGGEHRPHHRMLLVADRVLGVDRRHVGRRQVSAPPGPASGAVADGADAHVVALSEPRLRFAEQEVGADAVPDSVGMSGLSHGGEHERPKRQKRSSRCDGGVPLVRRSGRSAAVAASSCLRDANGQGC